MIRKLVLFSLLLLATPAAASANIYVPSLVEVISSPLMWSIYVVTMVITVPVILMIGLVETLAVKKYIGGASFQYVFGKLCLINMWTSLIRLPFSNSEAIWPGLPVSYILTIPAEAILLFWLLRKQLKIDSALRAYVLSIRMNTASYALLGLILLGVFYIPGMGAENAQVRENAGGRLVIFQSNDFRTLNIDKGKFIPSSNPDSCSISPTIMCSVKSGPSSFVYVKQISSVPDSKNNDFVIGRKTMDGSDCKTEMLGKVESVENIAAVSRDGRLLLCEMSDKWVIYDWRKRQAKKLPRQFEQIDYGEFSPNNRRLVVTETITHRSPSAPATESSRALLMDLASNKMTPLGNVHGFEFSPDSKKLMWKDENTIVIYDCIGRKRRTIPVRGTIYCRPTWSPDGNMVVYTGYVNPFTHNCWTRDIRVLDIRSGKSATIYSNLSDSPFAWRLLWLN